MTAIADPPNLAKYHSPARPTSTARRRFATAAVVAAALIIGVLGWRWVLVEATTDYGPGPDSLVGERDTRPRAKRSPPPIDLEVTVLDVHTAKAPAPAAARVPLKPASPTVPRAVSMRLR